MSSPGPAVSLVFCCESTEDSFGVKRPLGPVWSSGIERAEATGSKLDGGEVREDKGAAFVLRHRVCTSSDTDPTHTSTSDDQDTMSPSTDHRSDDPAQNGVSAAHRGHCYRSMIN